MSHAQVVGVPTEGLWSTTLTRELGGGHVFVVISSRGEEASLRGKAVVESISAYTGSIDFSSLASFFQNLATDTVSLAAIYSSNGELALFGSPTMAIWLSRGEKEEFIVSDPHKFVSFQGKMSEGDLFIVGTKKFFENLHTPMKSYLPAQELADELATTLPSQAGDSAALIISDRKNELPVVEKKIEKPRAAFISPVKLPKLSTQKSKKAMAIIVAVLGLLILLVLFSFFSDRSRKAANAKVLGPLQIRLQQAQTLGSRTQTLEALNSIEQDIAVLEQSKSTDASLKKELTLLEKQVSEQIRTRSGDKPQGKLNIFYDFRLVAQDFLANSIDFDAPGKALVVLDESKARILALSVEKKQTTVLDVDATLTKPDAIAIEDRKAYVLGQEGVMQLSLPLDVVGKLAAVKTTDWVSPSFLGVFGGNLYVFDKDAHDIFKYDGSALDQKPTSWFHSKEGLDFSKVVSFVVDGDVWIGTDTGSLLRFTRGSPAPFSPVDLPTAFSSAVYVYTTQSTSNLYVLEPRAKRIVTLGKDGTFAGSVSSDDLATATSLTVDESSHTAYVLSGSLVYSVPL